MKIETKFDIKEKVFLIFQESGECDCEGDECHEMHFSGLWSAACLGDEDGKPLPFTVSGIYIGAMEENEDETGTYYLLSEDDQEYLFREDELFQSFEEALEEAKKRTENASE